MTFIWRCTLCIDCGSERSHTAMLRAMFAHGVTHHPDEWMGDAA